MLSYKKSSHAMLINTVHLDSESSTGAWEVGAVLHCSHCTHIRNRFSVGEVYNLYYCKFFPLLFSQHNNILTLQQLESILRWAADTFKMIIVLLSWTLILRVTISVPMGKAILSSHSAFSNKTAIARYIQ